MISRTYFFALVDYGPKLGKAFEELDPDFNSEADLIRRIAHDAYSPGRVLSVMAFNTAEGWSADVSKDIAIKVAKFIFKRNSGGRIERGTLEFLEEHGGIYLANSLQAAE